jgi:hypothetical protein
VPALEKRRAQRLPQDEIAQRVEGEDDDLIGCRGRPRWHQTAVLQRIAAAECNTQILTVRRRASTLQTAQPRMRAILSARSACLLVLTVGLWQAARPADAQTVTVTGPDLVTVRAVNVPIATLLSELAGLAGMDRMEIDPVDRGQPVTLTVENVPVRVAMLIALRSSAVDFIFTEKRLRVGAGGKVIETTRLAAVASRDHDRMPAAPAAPLPPLTPAQLDHQDNRDGGLMRAAVDAGASQPGSAGAADAQEVPQAVATADEFDHGLSVRQVPFVVKEDSAVVTEPGFVPYKNRPDVQRLRLSTDVSTIP